MPWRIKRTPFLRIFSITYSENLLRYYRLYFKINPSQKAPVWATRYKFAIKQNKELYDTIYSTIFYVDKLSADIYFLLEGENAQKVSEGDVLHLKADSNGPLSECKKITVLEKESKESDFIEDILDQPVPAGVYMKVKKNAQNTLEMWNKC